MMTWKPIILLFGIVGVHSNLQDLDQIDLELLQDVPHNCLDAQQGTMTKCNKPKALTQCTRHYHKLGCYKKFSNATLMIDDTDPEQHSLNRLYSDGYVTDVSHLVESTHSLACRCARLTKEQGYKHFSLRYWGKCYGLPEPDVLASFDDPTKTSSHECGGSSNSHSNRTIAPCDPTASEECLGLNADYVYGNYDGHHDDPNIDGGYTPWQPWSPCTVSCGDGVMFRERTCTAPPPKGNGKDCRHLGEASEQKNCSLCDCAVDGGWSAWSEYESCSKTCGGGFKYRKRTCTSPEPKHGGLYCEGEDVQKASCERDPCPVDGCYSEWSSFGPCSTSCGEGEKIRTRRCNNPATAHGGRSCAHLGPATERASCNDQPCPVNGGYTLWNDFSRCSKSCNGGKQSRLRICANPMPLYGGAPCEGPPLEVENCNTERCPINGNWAEWAKWSKCSVSCNGGVRSRQRECSNPLPAHGGKECSGDAKQTEECNSQHCPIHGQWSHWSAYGECSEYCGGGKMKRERSCTNPHPQFGGRPCSGSDLEYASCNTDPCPVDGGYTEWGEWTECSRECDGGTQRRSRSCTNPETQGGLPCFVLLGDPEEMRRCNTHECAEYQGWGSWSQCTVSCGGGTQRRTRECTGEDCSHLGAREQTTDCNTQPCPVDGAWGRWTRWSPCSRTCGDGHKHRSRKCDSPKPQHGGKICPGPKNVTVSCKVKECPIDGQWSQWTAFGPCDRQCGGGRKQRTRECGDPEPKHRGKPCPGVVPDVNETSCNTQPCPEHGSWSNWGSWSRCTKTCGRGFQLRIRQCEGQAHGGDPCFGRRRGYKLCHTQPCPINGNWGTWSAYGPCSVSCGGGTQTATRKCDSPRAQHKGCKECPGLAKRTRECNTDFTNPCPVDGEYKPWGNWSKCSHNCGVGTTTRQRECIEPKHNGKPCSVLGNDTDTKLCNTHFCPRSHTASSCEGEVAVLSCKEGNGKITITNHHDIFYGRKEEKVCATKRVSTWDYKCEAPGGSAKVSKLCDGKQECRVPVNNAFFGGNPCPNTFKYLRVHYECHGGFYDNVRHQCDTHCKLKRDNPLLRRFHQNEWK